MVWFLWREWLYIAETDAIGRVLLMSIQAAWVGNMNAS